MELQQKYAKLEKEHVDLKEKFDNMSGAILAAKRNKLEDRLRAAGELVLEAEDGDIRKRMKANKKYALAYDALHGEGAHAKMLTDKDAALKYSACPSWLQKFSSAEVMEMAGLPHTDPRIKALPDAETLYSLGHDMFGTIYRDDGIAKIWDAEKAAYDAEESDVISNRVPDYVPRDANGRTILVHPTKPTNAKR